MAEWNNPENKGGLVWYTAGSKNNTDTGAGCRDGAPEGNTASLLDSTP